MNTPKSSSWMGLAREILVGVTPLVTIVLCFCMLMSIPELVVAAQVNNVCESIQYAELADNTYKDSKINDTFTSPTTGKKWKTLEVTDDSGWFGSDLQATLYEGDAGNLVLAFRGTEGFGINKDSYNDLMTGMNGDSAQLTLARQIALQIKNNPKYMGKEMIVTGHSLGGGLAQGAAAVTGFEAVTFNPAALGNFNGRDEALSANHPCINNYITQDDILDDIANPLSDAYGAENDQDKGTQSVGNNVRLGELSVDSGQLEFHDPALGNLLNEGGVFDQLSQEMNAKYNIPKEKQESFRVALNAARESARKAASGDSGVGIVVYRGWKVKEAFMDAYGDVLDEKIQSHLNYIPELSKACEKSKGEIPSGSVLGVGLPPPIETNNQRNGQGNTGRGVDKY